MHYREQPRETLDSWLDLGALHADPLPYRRAGHLSLMLVLRQSRKTLQVDPTSSLSLYRSCRHHFPRPGRELLPDHRSRPLSQTRVASGRETSRQYWGQRIVLSATTLFLTSVYLRLHSAKNVSTPTPTFGSKKCSPSSNQIAIRTRLLQQQSVASTSCNRRNSLFAIRTFD